MEKLKKLGEGNRSPDKRVIRDTAPAYQANLNQAIDKINELINNVVLSEEGYSLVADTEIAKIHEAGSDNQDLSGLVPYTGASSDVDLGVYSLGTSEIKTNSTTPTDLLITTGAAKTMLLSEPAWRDEYPAVIIPASGSAAPDSVAHTIGGIARQLYSFDGANTEERLSGSFEIPHDYMIGQPIEVHIHWRPSTTGTGVVKWFFDWELSKVHQAPAAQTGLTTTEEITNASQYVHFITTFGNLPALEYGIGDKIDFNIRRTPSDGSDTYGADALLEQVALHIPVDTLGSRQIYTK